MLVSDSTGGDDSAKATPAADYDVLYETYRSLGLLQTWWMPAHNADEAERAAESLRESMRAELSQGIGYLRSLNDDGREPTEGDQKRANELERLAANELFIAGAAARLINYQPNPKLSPYEAVLAALFGEVDRVLGTPPSGRVRPKRTDMGRELRRLFALAEDDAERRRVDGCLAQLTADQRDCLRTISTDGYKDLQRMGWSGQKIDETRRAAISVLVACMPELARFVVTAAQPKN